MSHYSDYYAEEAHKANIAKRKELLEAEEKLNALCYWDDDTKYILPDDVRENIRLKVLIPIRAELYMLNSALNNHEDE